MIVDTFLTSCHPWYSSSHCTNKEASCDARQEKRLRLTSQCVYVLKEMHLDGFAFYGSTQRVMRNKLSNLTAHSRSNLM